ncbi:MAG: peptidoglycan-binding protein [Blautia sp.]|nr:peptidoglycan-binding protein [Blautia sp.]
MKKRVLWILLTAVLLVLSASFVYADVMYADYDNVPVFSEQDINSNIVSWYRGGESVLIETYSANMAWAGVLTEDGDPLGGQTIGWVPMNALSYTIPQQYCSHQWSDWVVTEQPTCTSTGTRIRNCAICGATDMQVIAVSAHSFGPWTVTKQATCVEQGVVAHRCTVCGYEESTYIEKTGHSYNDWIVTKQATCTAEGERYRKCRVCGYEEHQTIDRLPHSFGDFVVTKDPTCTEEGIRMHKCQVCGYEATEPVEKLPHDFEWQILVEATDHSSGIRTNVCRVCGFTEEQVSFDPEGTLRRGDRSEEVREVQQLLADQNYLNAGGADGIFGGGTEKAIMEFQNDQGLEPDGVAWPQTIKRLHHDYNPWVTIEKMTRDTAGERERSCKECSYVQHEIVEPQPVLVKGDRGEGVRTMQKILTALGHDAGSFDGIYGSMLDAAYEGFARDNNIEFEAGKITPSQVDAVVGSWISAAPKEQWKGDGGLDSSINLALTVNPVLAEGEVLLEDGGPIAEKEAAAEAAGGEAAEAEAGEEAEAEVASVVGAAAEVAVVAGSEEAAEVAEVAGSEEVAEAAGSGEAVEVAGSGETAAAAGEDASESAGTEAVTDTDEENTEEAEESAETAEAAEGTEEPARIISYNYNITNLGDEDCTFVALLLNFGDDQNFLQDNLVMVIDGTVLKANCANSVSGTFSISSDWGSGEINFCALAVSEKTGDKWLSNVDVF